MYLITKDGVVRRIVEGACIPHDLRNTDYRTYLEWIADGNVAPVEPTPPPTPEQVEMTSLRRQLRDETEDQWLARTEVQRQKFILRALKAIEKRI
jgi:hypothetical protein